MKIHLIIFFVKKKVIANSFEYELSITQNYVNDTEWPFERKTICKRIEISYKNSKLYNINCEKEINGEYFVITNLNKLKFVLCEIHLFGYKNISEDNYLIFKSK